MDTVQENSNNKNPAGLYRHPETGAEVVARYHPKFGTPQADGLVRVGYVYVGPAPEERRTGDADSEPEQPKTAAQLRQELTEAEAREAGDKPLSKQNKTELEATAEREGVELTEAHDTNEKI